MLHIPILRRGEPYRSLDVNHAPHHRSREPFVEISQANPGLIRRDLSDQRAPIEALRAFSTGELVAICQRAAAHFAEDTLPLGATAQTVDDYIRQVSATTGLPHALARRNLAKIRGALAEMNNVVDGLTRRLDWSILDRGYGYHNGVAVSFYPRSDSLGVVLPSNSPGVHSLWVPSVALKMPLVLKPGASEPWTPWRLIQALIMAGCPREAFSYYPTDHAGSGEILRICGRGMLFGDVTSTAIWRGDPRVEIHGPGYSKILLAEDCSRNWQQYLDVIVASVLENSGRSCINASGVWVPAEYARPVAEAMAERLSRVEPRADEDPEAQLAPFADPAVAERISAMIDRDLDQPGAIDLTADHRRGERCVSWRGSTYLLPTVVLCDSPNHPLANREFLFPYASVVPVKGGDVPGTLGPTLVLTAITEDPKLIANLLRSPNVDRLNVGPIPTLRVRWDQPHEGNLFDHLYARRAYQDASVLSA